MKNETMILTDKLQQLAQKFGQSLYESPEVTAYQKAKKEVQNNSEASTLEEKMLALYHKLVSQEQSGQPLNQTELSEYYQIREQVNENPLIFSRNEELQRVKHLFADAGQTIASELGIDFSILAL